MREDAAAKGDQYGRNVPTTGDQVRRTAPPPPAKPGMPRWLLPLILALIVLGLLWWLLASCGSNAPAPTPSPTSTMVPSPTMAPSPTVGSSPTMGSSPTLVPSPTVSP